MPRRRNPVVRWGLSSLTILFLRLTQALPLAVSRRLGTGLGLLAYQLVPRLKRIGRANLDTAYRDTLSRREKELILKNAARNIGIVAAEFGRISEFGIEDWRKHVTLMGLEHVDRSKGALMIGAHFANWEWACAAMCALFSSGCAIVRPLDDSRLNRIVDDIRRSSGLTTIDKDNAGPEIIRRLRAGDYLGMLVDQNPRENAAPVTFFGAHTWASIAPAMIALRARVPIHPASIRREPNGSYTLRLRPALRIERTSSMREDLLRITQQCQDAIEEQIRACPEQWLWFHRRWRERPRLDKEWRNREAVATGNVPREITSTPILVETKKSRTREALRKESL